MNLNGKRALVTGGAVRIGRAIAEGGVVIGSPVITTFDSQAMAQKVDARYT